MKTGNENVPAPLRPWLAGIDALSDTPGDRGTLTHPPDAATALVFRTGAEGSDLLVMGPRTRASYHRDKQLALCVKVRIRPGRARPLLGTPVADLVDRVVPLGELWGASGERLARELARLGPEPGPVAERLQAELLAGLATRSSRDLERSDLLRTAALAMTARAHRRPESVAGLARRLAVSERRLRDLFTDGVGLPPKQLARIERVRAVLAHDGRRHWAELAAESGYYDQSHLTAEFRRLMGVPPHAFGSGRRPAAEPC